MSERLRKDKAVALKGLQWSFVAWIFCVLMDHVVIPAINANPLPYGTPPAQAQLLIFVVFALGSILVALLIALAMLFFKSFFWVVKRI